MDQNETGEQLPVEGGPTSGPLVQGCSGARSYHLGVCLPQVNPRTWTCLGGISWHEGSLEESALGVNGHPDTPSEPTLRPSIHIRSHKGEARQAPQRREAVWMGLQSTENMPCLMGLFTAWLHLSFVGSMENF